MSSTSLAMALAQGRAARGIEEALSARTQVSGERHASAPKWSKGGDGEADASGEGEDEDAGTR